jgi:hypothetical protein
MAGVAILGATAAGVQLSELFLHVMVSLSVLLSRMRNAPQVIAQRKLHVEQLFEIVQLVESCAPLQKRPIPDLLSSLLQQIREMEKMVVMATPAEGDGIMTRAQKLVFLGTQTKVLAVVTDESRGKEEFIDALHCDSRSEARSPNSLETVKLKATVEDSVKELVNRHGTITRAADVIDDFSTIIDRLKNSYVRNHRNDLTCYISATNPDLGIQSKDRMHDAVTAAPQNRVGGSKTGVC